MSAQNTRVLPEGPEAIAEAARLILAGELVAMPTETVYGLAADATNGEAVARIYEAKGRPSFNPLIIHVSDLAQAEEIAVFDEQARALAGAHWPGPLTLVLPRRKDAPIASLATAGLATVALRAPAHPAMRALIAAVGRPLAAPSANASGRISPTRAAHVLASLGGRIPLIVDGGPTAHGLESTIVALTGGPPRLLRPGPIDLGLSSAAEDAIEAPGQLASHYAPAKPLRLDAREAEPDEWLIGFGPVAGDASLSASGDLVEAAAKLFDLLHEADAGPAPRIAVAPIPDEGLGAAINDRLRRAAAPREEARMNWNDNLTVERPTFVTHLECSLTGERYEADRLHGLSAAGRPLLVRYDLAGAKRALDREALAGRPLDMWRWRELLPVRQRATSSASAKRQRRSFRWTRRRGGSASARLLVKDEGRLPTGSFKARGIAMAVSMAKALGVTKIAMPTNGNAGAALAAYAARAGIEAVVFCPDDTPEINVREIAAHGARVYRVNGLIDECGALVGEGAKAGAWFDLSTLKEPYRIEGKKTMGLELAEQLGWRLPDVIFYPTGGGTGLIGMWKGFAELEALGFIGPERPRMVAVQAEGCAPIVKAFEDGVEHAERWEDAHTIAAGIRVPKAVGDFLILRAVRESGGFAIAVPDAEIAAETERAAREDGLLLCPEGGATLAAAKRARETGLIGADDRVVLFNCATGLKYPLPDASRRLDRNAPFDPFAL